MLIKKLYSPSDGEHRIRLNDDEPLVWYIVSCFASHPATVGAEIDPKDERTIIVRVLSLPASPRPREVSVVLFTP